MSGEVQIKLSQALFVARISLPHLAGPLAAVSLEIDERVVTAGITPSGRVLFAPSFVKRHTVRELAFVIAHELYHAFYGIFERFDAIKDGEMKWLANVAHDFIVNEMLRSHFRNAGEVTYDETYDEKCFSGDAYIPNDALFWDNYYDDYFRLTGKVQPIIEAYTLESLVVELRELQKLCRERPARFLPPEMQREFSSSGAAREKLDGDDEENSDRNGSPFDALDSLFSDEEKAEREKAKSEQKAANRERARSEREAAESERAMVAREEADMQRELDEKASASCGLGVSVAGNPNRRTLDSLFRRKPAEEIFSGEREREMFPDESEIERQARMERFKIELEVGNEAFRRALADLATAGGRCPGAGVALVKAFAGSYKTPWERALQKSVEDFAYVERTWARASRRAGDRTDVVLPGRAHVGFRLNIVADTSGSMVSLLPIVLGMIQSFGRTAGLTTVRMVQCDTIVQADDVVDVESLGRIEMKGMGGGMNPAGMEHMADDPEVERVLVITDGYIAIPDDVPYDVTWCVLCDTGDTSHFQPAYGKVIGIPIEDLIALGA